MNKFAFVPVAALALMTACSEIPTGLPTSDNTLLGRSSTDGSNASSSVFDLAAPVITSPANGTALTSKTVTLAWTGAWNTNGTGSTFTFGHFEIYVNGDKLHETKNNSHTFELPGDGPWVLQVKAMAKEGTGPSTLTHHSQMSAAVNVSLAAEHSFAVMITNREGRGGDTQINVGRNANTWNVEFQLSHNGAPVNCNAAPADLTAVAATLEYGATSATAKQVTCNADMESTGYGRYTAQFDNPAQRTALQGVVRFSVEYDGMTYNAGSRALTSS